MASRKLIVEIVGDASSLERAFGKAGRQTKGFGSSLRGFGKAAAFTAGGAAFGGLVVAVQRGAKEFSESQKVAVQTRAVLKSTGGAARVTAKHITTLATSLSNLSGIDDEVIQSSENLLLTFTSVQNKVGKGNDIFDQATKAILDMSVALGQDTSSSAIQLGKALNDPIRGITALRRVGVQFTDDQQKQIKVLIQSGRQLDAQKLILRELTKEFGGSAKAAGTTFAGSLNKLRNTFDNLAATIVGAAAPAIQKYVDRLNVWLSKSENQEKVQKAVEKAVRVLSETVKGLIRVVEVLAPIIQKIVDVFGGWKNVIMILVGLKIAAVIRGWTIAIGALGAASTGATVGVVGLLAKLTALAALAAKGFAIGGAGVESRTPVFKNGKWHLGDKTLTDAEAGALGVNRLLPKTVVAPALDVVKKALQDISKGASGGRGTAARLSLGSMSPQVLSGVGVGGVNINGPITVITNDPDVFLRELQKRANTQTASRRGTFAGNRLGLA